MKKVSSETEPPEQRQPPELVVTPENAVTRTQAAPFNIEELFRYAIEKGGNLESLMNVRRELNAEASKQLFDEAMAAFQAECPVISKTIGVPDRSGKVAYKFAPFEVIIAAVKPLLQKHGFGYALDTDTESKDGWVIAKCRITHRGDPSQKIPGHETVSTAKFPLGTKTGIMSDTQVHAAALTFASRRVFCNAFGIVTAGEDSNGITSKEKPANPSSLEPDEKVLKDLARELWTLLKPVRGTAQNWLVANQWMWREEILDGGIPEDAPHLSPELFKEVIAKCAVHPALKPV
jgi:ERF superfamily